jgi:hypothetical protein
MDDGICTEVLTKHLCHCCHGLIWDIIPALVPGIDKTQEKPIRIGWLLTKIMPWDLFMYRAGVLHSQQCLEENCRILLGKLNCVSAAAIKRDPNCTSGSMEMVQCMDRQIFEVSHSVRNIDRMAGTGHHTWTCSSLLCQAFIRVHQFCSITDIYAPYLNKYYIYIYFF